MATAASPKEKFDAAVRVIQSIPKDASSVMALRKFAPSYTLMLKFYAYFKQATLGPCDIPRPAFWDVVGKAKWDAWNKLGEMPREDAMVSYVEELKKIIEAMPHTDMVEDFIEKLGNFYELVDDETQQHTPKHIKTILTKGIPNGKLSNGKRALKANGSVNVNGTAAMSRSSGDSTGDSDSLTEAADMSLEVDNLLAMHKADLDMSVPILDPSTTHGPGLADLNGLLPSEAPSNGISMLHTSGDAEGAEQRADEEEEQEPRSSEEGAELSTSDSEGEEFCDTSDLPQTVDARTGARSKMSVVAGDHRRQVITHGDLQQTAVYSQSAQYTKGFDSLNNNETDARQRERALRPQTSSTLNRVPSGGLTRDQSSSDFLFGPHQMVDRPSFADLPPYASDAVDAVMARGGGDTQGGGDGQAGTGLRRRGSNTSLSSQGRGGSASGSGHGSRRGGQISGAGGSAGGGRDQGGSSPYRGDVNEQIALALIRLQQDMNNVLSRLNTLETLTLTQHQISRSRHDSTSSKDHKNAVWWWPFSNLNVRTVFLFLAWPFIVHWVLTLLKRRRDRRLLR